MFGYEISCVYRVVVAVQVGVECGKRGFFWLRFLLVGGSVIFFEICEGHLEQGIFFDLDKCIVEVVFQCIFQFS
jgi:hypothetical protein